MKHRVNLGSSSGLKGPASTFARAIRFAAIAVPLCSIAARSSAADKTFVAAQGSVWDYTTPNWTVDGTNFTTFNSGDNAIFPASTAVEVNAAIIANTITFGPTGTVAVSLTDTDSNGSITAATITAPSGNAVTESFGASLLGNNVNITRNTGATGNQAQAVSVDINKSSLTGTLFVGGSSGGVFQVRQSAANVLPVVSVGGPAGTSQFLMNGFDATVAGLTVTTGSTGTRRFNNSSSTAKTLTISQGSSTPLTYSSQLGSTGASASDANNFAVVKTGSGLQELNNAVDLGSRLATPSAIAAGVGYFGNTTIQDGALGFAPILSNGQTTSFVYGPSSSLVILDGGIFQSTGAGVFKRTIGQAAGTYAGDATNFYWTANGGGFSSKGGSLTVNIGNDARTIDWGSTVGTNLVGILKFGHATATSETVFQNPINLNGAERTIDVADNASVTTDFATISGQITDGSGSGSLRKTGAGTLALSAAATYTGTTTVAGGTLRFNTSLSSTAAVSVLSGGTIGGKGSIAGPITVAAGGAVSPGASAGTLTVTSLDLTAALAGNNTNALDFEIGSKPLNAYDQIVGTSSSSINIGTGVLNFDDFKFTPPPSGVGIDPGDGSYAILTGVTGTIGSNRTGTLDGFTATLSQTGSTVFLNLSGTPEPASIGLLSLCGLGLLGRRRRLSRA